MGNQLVGIAPSQIFPVEHYLTDHTDIQYDINLGSTRFFKVARARSQEGLVVVKVFAIHDPTLPLSTYRDRIEEIKTKLASANNCLPFQRSILTDRAGFLMRGYIKYSLYDRISTRPFLTSLEKKWVAFQILYALHQCHRLGICHGDIKLENILITSWHWVLLSDFASFKPTHLPEDNPADFSYFFDTSRRRTCYIAPERFIKTLASDTSQVLLSEHNIKKDDLTPGMDIFSAGCCLIELFTEGQPPFDFSQLLAYRSGEFSVQKHLQKIEDIGVRNLVASMVERDPSKRKTAEDYLSKERGKVFPEYFYTFLQSYMLIFSSSTPILSPDEKIERLKKDICHIVKLMKTDEVREEEGEEKKNISRNDPLVIITSLVTSCIRGLHLANSKIQSLEILLELATHTSADTVLDRILPFILHSMQDPTHRVRVCAIHTLTKCLSLVRTIPTSDANVFPEYILPAIANVAHDDAVIVRTAFAENIAELASTALRFLDYVQVASAQSQESVARQSYESELSALHETVQLPVAALLTDHHNVVKQTLIENGIGKLCVFFGKQKANDVILSHMITFLNDKNDKQLRMAFFRCIVGVAVYIGVHCSPILCPLLQQGLTDPDEFVVREAINAMSALAELGLLYKPALYDLLADTGCFLVHPSLWIRQAIVGFLKALAKTLNVVDVQCKVMSMIKPYLKTDVIQLDKEVIVLSALQPPVPRLVYDVVVSCPDLDLFLHTLGERQRARLKSGLSLAQTPVFPAVAASPKQNNTIRSLFNRLSSEGMTEGVEDQLIAMSKHLHKIHKYTGNLELQPANQGKIDLATLRNPSCHAIPLVRADQPKSDNSAFRRGVEDYSISVTMNEEWRHMFGNGEPPSSSKMSELGIKTNSASVVSSDSQISPQRSLDTEYSLQERSYIQYRYAPCKLELKRLVARRQELYSGAARAHEWAEHEAWAPPLPPPGWRLRGALVAHLHEHKAAVNRLVPITESTLFASCSSDGCIRLWDCGKMEGRNIANRSRQVYAGHSGSLVGMTLCQNNRSLATISSTGAVLVVRIETGTNKMAIMQSRQLDLHEEGAAVDISHHGSSSQSVLVYATMLGCIIGWDLRAPGLAWKLDNDLRKGVISAMCLDARQCYLALGTSSGYHTVWDLRFQMPITTFPAHPTDRAPQRIRRLVKHPSEPSWLLSASQGHNEVTMWNMESGNRQVILWGSPAPPLSTSQPSPHSVCGMYASNVDHSPFLLTGGSDQKIRHWDLESYDNSRMTVIGGQDNPQVTYTYKCRMIDGTNVVQEVSHKPASGPGSGVEESPRAGPDPPSPGHHDGITDLAMCQAGQCFLLSAARDGVVKVWK